MDEWIKKMLQEEGMATHSRILAWRIPWTEKPGRLQSTGSQRDGHDWSNWAGISVCVCVCASWTNCPGIIASLILHKYMQLQNKEMRFFFSLQLTYPRRLFCKVPGGSSGKELASQCRRCKRFRFNLRVGKIPWKRAWQPTPVLLPRESQVQRSLAGNSA